MREKQKNKRQIENCWEKIQTILNEYNAHIVYDKTIKMPCLYDLDTKDAVWFIGQKEIKPF